MSSEDYEQLDLDLLEGVTFLDKLEEFYRDHKSFECKPLRFPHEMYKIPIEDYEYPMLDHPCLNCPNFGKGPCNCIVPYLY